MSDRKYAMLAPYIPVVGLLNGYPKEWVRRKATCGHECIVSAQMVAFMKEHPDTVGVCTTCFPAYAEKEEDPDKRVAMLPGQEQEVERLMGKERGQEAVRVGLAEFEMLGFRPVSFEELTSDGEAD